MPIECAFHFNKPYVSSGEAVEGFITLKLTNPDHVGRMRITLNGRGCVKWTEEEAVFVRHTKRTVMVTVEYRSEQTYAQVHQNLMENAYLQSGEHAFPFALQLPANTPGSFEGTLGSIEYNVVVSLDFETRLVRRESFTSEVIVRKRDDLNLHPEYKVPVQVEEIKSICYLCCTRGRIYFTLTTPIGAYVPMQQLHFTLRVENQSMTDVDSFEVTIEQIIAYVAYTPRLNLRIKKHNVVEEECDFKCLKLTTRVLGYDIQIPPLPPSNKEDDEVDERTVALAESLPAVRNPDVPELRSSALVLPSSSSGGVRPPAYISFKPPSFSEATKYSEKPPPKFDSTIQASAPPCARFNNERNWPI